MCRVLWCDINGCPVAYRHSNANDGWVFFTSEETVQFYRNRQESNKQQQYLTKIELEHYFWYVIISYLKGFSKTKSYWSVSLTELFSYSRHFARSIIFPLYVWRHLINPGFYYARLQVYYVACLNFTVNKIAAFFAVSTL